MEFEGTKMDVGGNWTDREPVGAEVAASSASESEVGSGEQGGASQRNTWIGIRIKRGFGFGQWVALPLLACGTMIVGVYLNT